MGPHCGYTYQTTGRVNRGHVAMISAIHDSNQENDSHSMIPIDFEWPKMPKSGFQITAFFDQSTASIKKSENKLKTNPRDIFRNFDYLSLEHVLF